MAPSQTLFPFNRFTGGRKPKLPCRGLGDEMTPVPTCCLPPSIISSPLEHRPVPAPAAQDRCCSRPGQIPRDERGADRVLPAAIAARPVGRKPKNSLKKKKKTYIFSAETADSSPGQPAPNAGVWMFPNEQRWQGGRCPHRASLCSGKQAPGWVRGCSSSMKSPSGKSLASEKKKDFNHPKSKVLS